MRKKTALSNLSVKVELQYLCIWIARYIVGKYKSFFVKESLTHNLSARLCHELIANTHSLLTSLLPVICIQLEFVLGQS